jgi:hypothetical protein
VSATRAKTDPYKRYRTRQRGITYRIREDGSRTYYVTAGSRHPRVDGGEREALLVQADLRGSAPGSPSSESSIAAAATATPSRRPSSRAGSGNSKNGRCG